MIIPKKISLHRSFFICVVICEILAFSHSDTSISWASCGASQTPEFGGSARLSIFSEPITCNPVLAVDASSYRIICLVYVSLVKYDKDLRIIPWAAKTYKVLDDRQCIQFTLREDIYWEDGVQFTVDDVEATYKYVMDPKTPSPWFEYFLNIKEFKKTGRFSFEVYYSDLPANALTSWTLFILPKHIIDQGEEALQHCATHPVGSGAFKVKKRDFNGTIILEASDTYFEGRPYIDEVIMKVIPDSVTTFLELRSGNIDMMRLSPQQYAKQTSGPMWDTKWKKYRYLDSAYTFLGFNLNNPLFSDVLTRKAITYAIDRDLIINTVLYGQAIPLDSPYKPGTWVYNDKLEPMKYDVEKAKKLFAQAGWEKNKDGILERNGVPFSFTISYHNGLSIREQTASIIQNQLKKVGIDVKLRSMEWATFLKEYVEKQQFEAILFAWSIPEDPDISGVWHSRNSSTGFLNYTGYNNKDVDRLLEEAHLELDQNKQKILYDKFQEILHEEQPYCFLYVPYVMSIVNSKFHGIVESPLGIMHNFNRWWIPKSLQ